MDDASKPTYQEWNVITLTWECDVFFSPLPDVSYTSAVHVAFPIIDYIIMFGSNGSGRVFGAFRRKSWYLQCMQ